MKILYKVVKRKKQNIIEHFPKTNLKKIDLKIELFIYFFL